MPNLHANFIEHVRRAMLKQGVTQQEMANALGVSRAYVNRILRGEVCPRLDVCEKMANHVGIKLKSAFFGKVPSKT